MHKLNAEVSALSGTSEASRARRILPWVLAALLVGGSGCMTMAAIDRAKDRAAAREYEQRMQRERENREAREEKERAEREAQRKSQAASPAQMQEK